MLLPPPSDPLVLRIHRRARKTFPFRRLTALFWQEVTATLRGARFSLRPFQNGSETHAWRTGDLREPRSTELLLAEIGTAPCFIVDIGANCGFFTVFLAKYAAGGSRILAYEPNPEMVARLRHNLTLNGIENRVDIHQAALSDGSQDEATLFVERSRGDSSLERSDTAVHEITVPLRTLGDVLDEAPEDQKIVVKIDVEGHEPSVLLPLFHHPAARLPDVILMEVVHREKWSEDLLGILGDAGYTSVFDGEDNAIFRRNR